MLKRSKSHLRHNVVAYLALFLALGGTAVAAKPLVNGADVEDGSLTGADLSDSSTLKGVDIDESALDGVARFGGIVDFVGDSNEPMLRQGTGRFTVAGDEVGGSPVTRIVFPPGTFTGCHLPIVNVTPQGFGRFQSESIAFVASTECDPDGSANVVVASRLNTDTASTMFTVPFMFIAI